MSKKAQPKGSSKRPGMTPGLILKSRRTAPAKKTGRHVTADKATSCFDGAGDLNPSKTKVGQPKRK